MRRLPLIAFLLVALAVSGITAAGAAIGPVTFSPAGLDFGSADVGTTSSEQTIDVTNSGTDPLVISSVDIGGINPGSFQISSPCSGTLAAGSTCTIGVQFAPKSAGSLAAKLDINY